MLLRLTLTGTLFRLRPPIINCIALVVAIILQITLQEAKHQVDDMGICSED